MSTDIPPSSPRDLASSEAFNAAIPEITQMEADLAALKRILNNVDKQKQRALDIEQDILNRNPQWGHRHPPSVRPNA